MKNKIILSTIIGIFIIGFFTSCSEKQQIKFKVINLTNSNIDSVKIVLENQETGYYSAIKPENGKVLDMSCCNNSRNLAGKVFEIYYSQEGQFFMANFGYHTGRIDIEKNYSLFIFPGGVNEIKNKFPSSNNNKKSIKNWP